MIKSSEPNLGEAGRHAELWGGWCSTSMQGGRPTRTREAMYLFQFMVRICDQYPEHHAAQALAGETLMWLPGTERQTPMQVLFARHRTNIYRWLAVRRVRFGRLSPHLFSLIARPCPPLRLLVRRGVFRARWWSRARFDARPRS